MRELRKNVDSTLDSPKEELVDNIDEMKIEEVLMGLKGLKQEEVFSFLGKNNFTPAETEMTSAGFGNYDQLTGVESADIEQLQLNFDSNFDGFQTSNGHVMPNGSYMQKNTSLAKFTDTKIKLRTDSVPIQKASVYQNADSFCDWSTRKDRPDGTIKLPSLDFRRTSAVWPKCPTAPVTYSLADGYLENLREEEIVSTPMTEISSDMIDTSNLDDEFKYPVNNTYVIQSSDGVGAVEIEDKPKPIKLLIKRVENEEEVSTTNPEPVIDNGRAKSKRIRNPCAKRKFMETSPPPKKKRCTRKVAANKPKDKNESPLLKKKNEPLEEFEFPFSTTVHQDDEFVYPSLDLSDDEEEDVYSFSQRDDETWTPKIKMKINEVKPSRPTRDRKTKSAVAKCLEAAAMKRADSDSTDDAGRRKKCAKKFPKKKLPPVAVLKKSTLNASSADSILSIDSDATGDLIIDDTVTSTSRDYTFNNLHTEYNVPSTSSNIRSTPSSSYSGALLSDSSIDTSPESSPVKPKLMKKDKPGQKPTKAKIRSKLVSPKTCKLIQTPPGTSSAASSTTAVAKRAKNDAACSPSSSSCAFDKKHSNAYVTKRGKPKKGMATAKQRLGKILKMHKMFF